MAIGALAAFLLVGPLFALYKSNAVASRPPQPSPSATVDPHASPTSCPASLPMPTSPGTAPAVNSPTLPYPVWVNNPLGVNLRPSPSTTYKPIATLTQGTQANADRQTADGSGNVWYHVSVGSQAGWVRADFVVATPLHAASGVGWSLMLPQGYQVSPSSDASTTTITKTGDDLPFLVLQSTTSGTLTVQLPALVRSDLGPTNDHAGTIQVWSYTVNEAVSRIALDTCKVASAWARSDQGWPYMTQVYLHTSGRNYQFTFFSPDPNSALVKQVLDSVALS
ncbi:MAG TPA: SH3 domain-containing protein [Candidatus Dormibacteraeota bacterium]|nr:SH3 domain-containing protein [Candidatus Dormibacteraeota bacterium]